MFKWTRLLRRVADLEHCPNCGGELRIIDSILETPIVERILTNLGLPARAQPRAPARARAAIGLAPAPSWVGGCPALDDDGRLCNT